MASPSDTQTLDVSPGFGDIRAVPYAQVVVALGCAPGEVLLTARWVCGWLEANPTCSQTDVTEVSRFCERHSTALRMDRFGARLIRLCHQRPPSAGAAPFMLDHVIANLSCERLADDVLTEHLPTPAVLAELLRREGMNSRPAYLYVNEVCRTDEVNGDLNAGEVIALTRVASS